MKILIAEDEKAIANSLKKNLEMAGFSAFICSNGETAYIELQKNKYDLLLLDWRMPRKNGYQLCLDLRKDGKKIPIILLTALTDISDKVDALRAGADDYITKPFSIEEVIARIDALLRRAGSVAHSINCGSFSLNLVTHSIDTVSNSIKLSEKEFELLNFLAANQGLVVSRDILHERVWGLNYSPLTNFVDVTMKNLRKKIEAVTDQKCIKTIYGEGYVFLGE